MAHTDPWLQEYQQATELVDDAFHHLQERNDSLRNGADAARLTATVRRKISGLNSKIDRLQALLGDSNSVYVSHHDSLLPNRHKNPTCPSPFRQTPALFFSPMSS